jgi:hypothetical protein
MLSDVKSKFKLTYPVTIVNLGKSFLFNSRNNSWLYIVQASKHLSKTQPTNTRVIEISLYQNSAKKWVRLSLCLTKHYAIRTYGGVDLQIRIFLTSATIGGEWSASRLSRFTLRGESPQYTLDRRLGEPQSRSGRYGEVKIPDPTETRTIASWSFSL